MSTNDNQQEYHQHRFENGLRFIYKQVHNTRISHCGVALDIGSRDELEHEQGIAHFWEHMAFKGTQNRKAFHIINRLESVGGELNAYTTKEKIYFYSTTLDQHLDRSLDLLSDITFRSTFPQKEIDKEAGVIVEEINMYEDSPEDAVFDEFDAVLFGNHPIGRNILGTRESVRSFKQEDFLSFIDRNLDTSRAIISIVSSHSFEKALKIVSKHFEGIEKKTRTRKRITAPILPPTHIVKHKAISQAHCMLGRTCFSINHENRVPFFMLNSIFGMGNMSSRLNIALREKRGLVYSIETEYAPFSDVGQFHIYFGTEKKQVKRALSIIYKEMDRLRNIPLGTKQLSDLKARTCAHLAMAEENNGGIMQVMAKSILDLGKIENLNDIFDLVNSVTAEDLQSLANQILIPESFSSLIYSPE